MSVHTLPAAHSRSSSPHRDHRYDSSCLPNITTAVLEHTDEVWDVQWSHNGEYLASAGKDKRAIIWRIGSGKVPAQREYTQHLVLPGHQYPVGCVVWSLNDSVLLTSSDNHIKIWNTGSGLCTCTIETHSETVSAIRWLPDNSGFVSASLDRRILVWDAEGNQTDSWGMAAIRITDLDISPDMTKVVAVGIVPSLSTPPPPSSAEAPPPQSYGPGCSGKAEDRMVVYDMSTKQMTASLELGGEITSVRISHDSRYALTSHAPGEIHLWDLSLPQAARKFTGQKQGRHVIRSCFGGVDGKFVTSGSEDGNVYVWDRESGALLEVLSGHGAGSVNSVAWNPKNERMLASCSDDKTIRIWEAVAPLGTLEV